MLSRLVCWLMGHPIVSSAWDAKFSDVIDGQGSELMTKSWRCPRCGQRRWELLELFAMGAEGAYWRVIDHGTGEPPGIEVGGGLTGIVDEPLAGAE